LTADLSYSSSAGLHRSDLVRTKDAQTWLCQIGRRENQARLSTHSIWDGVMLVLQVLRLRAVASKISGGLYEIVNVVVWL
jgi:hypothetical protein